MRVPHQPVVRCPLTSIVVDEEIRDGFAASRPQSPAETTGPATTLRKLYATPWNPWTPMETLDNKNGRHLKKTLKWRPHAKLS